MPQYQGIWTLAQAAQLQSTQRWATDPLFENTTLLLQADNAANGAQNNTFLDSSSNNFTITRNGNTTQGSFTPFSLQPGAWSNYFASGAVLNLNGGTPLTFGTGDFTIEFWVYYNGGLTADVALYDSRDNVSGNGVYPLLYSNPTGKMVYYVSSAARITSTTSLVVGTWYHVALARSGTSTKLFINGIQEGSTYSDSNNYLLGTNRPTIGAAGISLGADPLNGYMSNVRVVKGTAVYTSNFTPPTSPLTAITNTSLLTCQSNRFIDNSSNAFAITVTGTPSVQAFSPFAPQYQYTPSVTGGSGYFDGTGDTLTAANNAAFQFGTGDFEVSGWVYPTSYASVRGFFSNGVASNGTLFSNLTTAGRFESWIYGDAIQTPTINVPLNAWTHLTISRVGTAFRTFVNGVQDISYTTSRDISAQGCIVGDAFTNGGFLFQGYISSVRVRKGSGVSSVIVPTAPSTAITNTSLLLNFTNAGIYDGTLKNNLETVGNAQVSTSVVKYGTGSMYFDGTGDYLKGVYSPNMILSGDFTIECWLYYTAHGNYGGIVSFANANTALPPTSGWAFVFYSTTDKLYFETGTGFGLQTTNAIPSGQWNHVAVVRSGSTITHYLNGVANGSGTSSATFTILTTDNFVIGIDRGLAQTMTGYIDDLRITRGIARYTANFTPPSVALPRQ